MFFAAGSSIAHTLTLTFLFDATGRCISAKNYEKLWQHTPDLRISTINTTSSGAITSPASLAFIITSRSTDDRSSSVQAIQTAKRTLYVTNSYQKQFSSSVQEIEDEKVSTNYPVKEQQGAGIKKLNPIFVSHPELLKTRIQTSDVIIVAIVLLLLLVLSIMFVVIIAYP